MTMPIQTSQSNLTTKSSIWDNVIKQVTVGKSIDYREQREIIQKAIPEEQVKEREHLYYLMYQAEYRKKNRETLKKKARYRYFIQKYGYIPKKYIDELKEIIIYEQDKAELKMARSVSLVKGEVIPRRLHRKK